MKLSKVIFGLAAVLSLTACGKGKEVSKEDFAEEVKNIKGRKDLEKAVVSYEVINKFKKDGKIEETKGKGSGEYTYSNKRWEKSSDQNDTILDEYYMIIFATTRMTRESKVSDPADDKNTKVKYHIKPLGIEEEKNIDGVDSIDASGLVSKGTIYSYYEWDEYGYLTKMEYDVKGDLKNSTVGEFVELNLDFNISYK